MKSLLLLAGLGVCFQPQDSTLEKIEREVSAIVEKARKSSVTITASYTVEFEPRVQVTESMTLSGLVYTADGYIITDGSALENAKEIVVALPDGKKLQAQLIAVDRRTSIAVLKVKAEGLTPAILADPKEVKQGIYAIVVGNQLGMKASSSIGFVSGLGRTIQVGGRRYEDMVQMTTPVTLGDCGACVVNSRGQCVAMVNSGYNAQAADIESLGILKLFGKDTSDFTSSGPNTTSFATPGSTIKFVVDRIIKHGKMVRGWAGLAVKSIDDGVRAQLKIKDGQGVEVTSVDRTGPAAKAGLKRRDIILTWDGAAVTDPKMLKKMVIELEAAKTVKIMYLRGGAPFEVELEVKIEP